MAISTSELLGAITVVDGMVEEALTIFGQPELEPIVAALTALAAKALQASQAASPSLAMGVVASEAAADTAEAEKFPKAPGQS